jgi:hypothetical protein
MIVHVYRIEEACLPLTSASRQPSRRGGADLDTLSVSASVGTLPLSGLGVHPDAASPGHFFVSL